MRFIVFVVADRGSEMSGMPEKKDLAEMNKFNEQLVNAGMMLAGEGLHPSKEATRIAFSDGSSNVSDGPSTESKELVAGYWILKAKSKDEVIDWMKRAPFKDGKLEIRQIFEPEDFAYAPEIVQQEKRLRAQMAKNQPS